jgi:SAM-dependent methyltransferase
MTSAEAGERLPPVRSRRRQLRPDPRRGGTRPSVRPRAGAVLGPVEAGPGDRCRDGRDRPGPDRARVPRGRGGSVAAHAPGGSSRIGSRVAAGDAHRLPTADASWDQAYSVWLLHVVGDPARVLAEVGRILRPGGAYLLIPAMWERAADPIGEIDWTLHRGLDPAGLRSLSEERLRALAGPAGLRVVQAVTWTHRFEESPAEAIRKIETRAYSFLWEITDERWERFVAPVIEALRALPDPEAPITRIANNRLLLLQKGSAEAGIRSQDGSGPLTDLRCDRDRSPRTG